MDKDNILNNYTLAPKSLAMLMEKDFPPNHWTVENLIPSQSITILSGAPTSCKTWIMLEIAKCVAQGIDLFDNFPTKQTGVLIIDEESGERLLQDRFKILRSPDNLPIYYLSMCGQKITDKYISELIKWCSSNSVGLVMMDSFVRMHDGDENAARDVAKVFKLIRNLTTSELTVLIAHHNRKTNINNIGSQQMMRGSSDILASIDCQLAVSRPQRNELLTIEQTKCRIAPELPQIEIRFNQFQEYSEFEYLGQKDNLNKNLALKNKVIEIITAKQNLNQTDIADKLESFGLKKNPKTLRNILETMEREKLITVIQGTKNSKMYSINLGDNHQIISSVKR